MKKKILKQLGKKISFKGVTIRLIPDISVETIEARKYWDVFKILKENNCQYRILYPVTICFKIANERSLTITILYIL